MAVAGPKEGATGEWPFYGTCLLMFLVAPLAAVIAVRMIPIQTNTAFAFPLAMLIGTALLSVLGVALSPAAKWKVVIASALVVVGSLFALWMATSSIGGWRPSALGIVLSCVGACAGLLVAPVALFQRRMMVVALTWVGVGVMSLLASALGLAAHSNQMAETQKKAPAYFERKVLPMYFADGMEWKSQGPTKGSENLGVEYRADGQVKNHNVRVHLDVSGRRAAYVITLYSKEDFVRGPQDELDARLMRAESWLLQQGVITLSLKNLDVYSSRWMADTDSGTVYIEPFKGGATISGWADLPAS